jgi:phosphopantothenoylcysteine decarboxylase/phosphopantothenate--cysteine ligase
VSDAGAVPKKAGGPSQPERPLAGANVVLGVSGGIAAYKAVELCRRLVDAGAHVVPVLTASATRFVGAATFSALASEPARLDLFADNLPIPHTELARRADLVVVAPATARVIGSYAAGISSDLLVATLLATRAPVLVCPAMHTEMWEHAAVRENVAKLRLRGVHVLEPESGHLAGGDVGAGRLPETGVILEAAEAILSQKALKPPRSGPLSGRKVLVSAGGTREPIDPVRYVSNRSSGKQGHALAEVALEMGARVTLVTASELAVAPGVAVVEVETAQEMATAVLERAAEADLVVMAAAVSDYRPEDMAPTKLHRADGVLEIRLVPTLDILAELARRRRPGQVLVGFAAETDHLAGRALSKLEAKGLDLLVANDVAADGVGFSHDTNAVTIFQRGGGRLEVPLRSKRDIAEAVLQATLPLLHEARQEIETEEQER